MPNTEPQPATTWKNITVAGGGILTGVLAAVLTAFSGWEHALQADVVKTCLWAVTAIVVSYIVTDRLLAVLRPK